MRNIPRILICGTPGTGKSSLCSILDGIEGFIHVNLSEVIRENNLYSEWDEEFQCWTFDDSKVLDFLDYDLKEGGQIVEFHSVDFFPEDWFDLIVVLRASTEVLFDRLEARGYSENKRKENMESEIFQVVVDEATEKFGEHKVLQRNSNCVQDLEENAFFIKNWLSDFRS